MSRPSVQTMLEDLRSQGITHRQIARAVSCHSKTLYYIQVGYTKQPGYELGRAIEDLWANLCLPENADG